MGGTTFTYNPDNSIKRTGAAAADNGYFPFGGLKTDECADYTYDGFDREKVATRRVVTCPAATASHVSDALDDVGRPPPAPQQHCSATTAAPKPSPARNPAPPSRPTSSARIRCRSRFRTTAPERSPNTSPTTDKAASPRSPREPRSACAATASTPSVPPKESDALRSRRTSGGIKARNATPPQVATASVAALTSPAKPPSAPGHDGRSGQLREPLRRSRPPHY